MFCDLVGSTSLAAGLDPEDFRAIIRSYQETCAAAVERYAGHTAQYRGDGILVLFGWPEAHEDDAQRAAHAALAIVEDLRQLNAELEAERGVRLSVRIGIHSGAAVVGDAQGDSVERQVLGHALNLAARLQDAAPLDGIVVTQDTLRLLRGRFVTEDFGAVPVKGLPDPVPAHRLCGRVAMVEESAAGSVPLVGRDAELSALLQSWAQVVAGTGRAVLIAGDPGIGKSRLVEALADGIGGERHVWLRMQGAPYHVSSAFYAVARVVQRQLGVRASDPPERRLAALEQLLAATGRAGRRDLLPALGTLLGMAAPTRLDTREGSGDAHRREILHGLADWLAHLAAELPAVVLVEDVHWLDPSTRDLLALLAERVAASRILLVLTLRPGFDPPWSDRPGVLRLVLEPLSSGHAAVLVQKVAGARTIPARIVRELVGRADGVPLFVEELTRAVLESGSLEVQPSRRRVRQSRLDVVIPATLQESLAARLDRLGPAKEVAQLGAVIGREFSLDVLRAVAPMEPMALERELDRLIDAGLLHRRGLIQVRYAFKHALIRDAAYDSLLRARRQAIHARVAAVLAAGPASSEDPPEVVAWHYEQAGASDSALTWYEAALASATTSSAYPEAVTHGQHALEMLARLPEGTVRDERELALHVALGPNLIALHGYGAHEVEDTYERAHALCGERGDAGELVEMLWGLANYYQARAQLDTAKELGERLVAITRAGDDVRPKVWAHLQLGATHYWRGEYRAALDHLDGAVTGYDPTGSWFLPGAPDPWVAAQAYRGLVLWTIGRPASGLRACQDSVARAREGTHPFSLGLALCFLGALHQLRREVDAVAACADEVMALARAHGFPNWLGWGEVLCGWAHAHAGRGERALEMMQDGLREMRHSGTILGAPALLLQFAEIQCALSRADEAMASVQAGLALAADTKQHAWEGELRRLDGELALAAGRDGDAAQALAAALANAHEADALSYELRAAAALVRLERCANGGAAAERLAGVLARFEEGRETRDHLEARALLDAPA